MAEPPDTVPQTVPLPPKGEPKALPQEPIQRPWYAAFMAADPGEPKPAPQEPAQRSLAPAVTPLPPHLISRIKELAKGVGEVAEATTARKLEEFFAEMGPLVEDCIAAPRRGSNPAKAASFSSDSSSLPSATTIPGRRTVEKAPQRAPSPERIPSPERRATAASDMRAPSREGTGLMTPCITPGEQTSGRSSDRWQRQQSSAICSFPSGETPVGTRNSGISRQSSTRSLKKKSLPDKVKSFFYLDEDEYSDRMGRTLMLERYIKAQPVVAHQSTNPREQSGKSMSVVNSEKSNYQGSLLDVPTTLQIEEMLNSQAILPCNRQHSFVQDALHKVVPSTVMEKVHSIHGVVDAVIPCDHKASLTDDLRVANDRAVTKSLMVRPQMSASAGRTFPWIMTWFRIWGIFPCRHAFKKQPAKAHFNRYISTCITIAIIVYEVEKLSRAWPKKVHRLTDLVLAINGFACLMSLHSLHHCQAFVSDAALILIYAKKHLFDVRWRWDSTRDLVIFVLAWISIVVVRVLLGGIGQWNGAFDVFNTEADRVVPSYLDIAAFAFSTGIFTNVTFFLVHFVNSFRLAVDTFAYDFITEQPNCAQGAHEWDTIRAILRLSSEAMRRLITVLAATSAVMMVLCSVDTILHNSDGAGGITILGTMPVLLPVAGLVWLTGFALLRAANITGACERLPPIINSFRSYTDEDDKERLVRYIQNSAAGFYIGDVILRTEAVVKVINVGVVVMLTVLTKSMTASS